MKDATKAAMKATLALLGAIAATIIIAYLLRDFLDNLCKF